MSPTRCCRRCATSSAGTTRKRPERGVVACGHPATAAAAAGTLAGGGNAFDACIAAGFAATVAEPTLTSLGGGGFLLARTSVGSDGSDGSEGHETVYDFFVDTPGRGGAVGVAEPHFETVTLRFPASTQDFNVGMASVAVPGTLAGLLHVHERLGRLPLEAVVAPAIALARDGVEITAGQAEFVAILRPILTSSPAGAALYAGDRFVSPDLAAFIESLVRGDTRSLPAARVAEDMASGGGLLTREDLETYTVYERAPLEIDYRGRRILTNPPPSFGGSLIAQELTLLEQTDVAEWGSPAHLQTLLEVLTEVDRRRGEGLAAPRRTSRGTTHVSVSDSDGNLAAMTASNGEGSGYVVPGTGVMLNNMMGEDDLHPQGFHAGPPGLRVGSMMAPTLVLDPSGRSPALSLGSGGSKRIRTAILQVVSNIVDYGLDLQAAVDAPRLHWDGDVLQIEPGFPEEAISALDRLAPVNVWPGRNLYFGGVHVIRTDGACAGDARRGGSTMVVG